MADVTKINGYIIKDANAPHPSNAGSAGQVLKKTETGTEWADASFKPAGKSYLTFSSPNSFTLKVNDTTKHWDGTLEYFASDRTWTVWDGTTTLSSVDNYGEHVLYLRGTGNTVINGSIMEPFFGWVLTGTDIACIGNIENLLDYATVQSGAHPTMADNCYACMFQSCTGIIKAPELPAITLTNRCYYRMFAGCTSLTQAPALPATTLADNCYDCMFQDCTSFTQAPALPATTLANSCYRYMFYGCASLTQAPALPATTLPDYCYYGMFYGCTSLKLSYTKDGEYMVAYRIPTSGTGTSATHAVTNMFRYTGGNFTGTPSINTTYYLSSDNMVVYDTELATLREYVGSMIMVGAIPADEKGTANGVASLGSDGKVPSTQLPSLDYIPISQKGAAGGVASLGADGKVPSAQLPEMGAASYTITLHAAAWANEGSRYSQMVNMTGVTASTPVVLVDVALSGTDLDADAAALEAWGIVSANNVEQGNGRLTFYALSVPSVNIPVNVGVC